MKKSKTIYLVIAHFGNLDGTYYEYIKAFKSEEEAYRYANKFHKVIGKLSEFVSECWDMFESVDYKSIEEEYNCFYYKIWAKYKDLHQPLDKVVVHPINYITV